MKSFKIQSDINSAEDIFVFKIIFIYYCISAEIFEGFYFLQNLIYFDDNLQSQVTDIINKIKFFHQKQEFPAVQEHIRNFHQKCCQQEKITPQEIEDFFNTRVKIQEKSEQSNSWWQKLFQPNDKQQNSWTFDLQNLKPYLHADFFCHLSKADRINFLNGFCLICNINLLDAAHFLQTQGLNFEINRGDFANQNCVFLIIQDQQFTSQIKTLKERFGADKFFKDFFEQNIIIDENSIKLKISTEKELNLSKNIFKLREIYFYIDEINTNNNTNLIVEIEDPTIGKAKIKIITDNQVIGEFNFDIAFDQIKAKIEENLQKKQIYKEQTANLANVQPKSLLEGFQPKKSTTQDSSPTEVNANYILWGLVIVNFLAFIFINVISFAILAVLSGGLFFFFQEENVLQGQANPFLREVQSQPLMTAPEIIVQSP